ncbi:Aste57867_14210 [Aphanomyces stellatus]|uniref:Aste57867_14210 protein n=1 Tax=Aphanomyces stellatus TaxID=120398 RepID=A0A485L1R2_9STRA|nr:hypothetical protein As57867_014159 [Aphanomyces stellatus]VFT91035.1 Aste57867_14210 [Aphanomyces stellatus]
MSQANTPVRGILRTSDSKASRRTSSPAVLSPAKDDAHTPLSSKRRRESTGAGSAAAKPSLATSDLYSPRRVTFSPYVPTLQRKSSKPSLPAPKKLATGDVLAVDDPAVAKETIWRMRRMRMRYAFARRESLTTRVQKRLVSMWMRFWSTAPSEASVRIPDAASTLPDLWAIDQAYIARQNRLMDDLLHDIRRGSGGSIATSVEHEARVSLRYTGSFDAFLDGLRPRQAADDQEMVALALELPGLRRDTHRRQ